MLGLLIGLMACAQSARDRAWVSDTLAVRHGLPRSQGTLAHGLTAREAIAIALARNPAYQANLARLDSARADLDEARRPTNPQLGLLAALGPISAMATLLAPLDSLWLVPTRSKLAARTLESVSESLVQTGLDLARDTQVAHAVRALAEERVAIRRELVAIWNDLAELAEQRVLAGEAAPSEALSVRADAELAQDALAVGEAELEVARAQLRTLLGFGAEVPGFALAFDEQPVSLPALASLTSVARSARPDVRASELAVLAACAQAGWERARIFALAAYMEGHWTRPDMLAARLGGRVDLPIFGANPGGRGRAQAEIARTTSAAVATRQRVMLEVVQAYASAAQGRTSLVRYRERVLPALVSAQETASESYRLGEEAYLVVLDLMRRRGEARLREAELVAQVRRADAELERATGARIGAP
ncbi:MAG TPA: TolC family protein [Polyangiales bacterium]|nr:TolC family protein [Polyangiales bacterium]